MDGVYETWGRQSRTFNTFVAALAPPLCGIGLDWIGFARNNIEGTLNLVECMQKQPGCRKLVFSSSATVYGEPDKLPLDETSSVGVGITNPYGACRVRKLAECASSQ